MLFLIITLSKTSQKKKINKFSSRVDIIIENVEKFRRELVQRIPRTYARIVGPVIPRTRINRRQGKHITAVRKIAVG